MKTILDRLPLYLSYYLQKVDEHSLQGPFAFHFANDILKGDSGKDFTYIELKRAELKRSELEIDYFTFGKASKLSLRSRKKVSDIAKKGISTQKKSELFYRIIRKYNYNVVLELGTSLGINTCYLAEAVEDGRVITIEGHPSVADIAEKTFSQLGFSNIQLIRENIDETLAYSISGFNKLDFAFIDANHQSQALFNYFNTLLPKMSSQGAMAIDDIRWSRDMFNGWQMIIRNPRISHVFDLGDFGILFFKDVSSAQYFVLHF